MAIKKKVKTPSNVCCGITRTNRCHQTTCSVYGLGFIGAAVYYISTAGGFWLGVLGFLKALVWPAFLIFELLKFLGA